MITKDLSSFRCATRDTLREQFHSTLRKWLDASFHSRGDIAPNPLRFNGSDHIGQKFGQKSGVSSLNFWLCLAMRSQSWCKSWLNRMCDSGKYLKVIQETALESPISGHSYSEVQMVVLQRSDYESPLESNTSSLRSLHWHQLEWLLFNVKPIE